MAETETEEVEKEKFPVGCFVGIIIFVLVFGLVIFLGLEKEKTEKAAYKAAEQTIEKFSTDKHELRKLVEYTSTTSTAHSSFGGFFILGTGAIGGNASQATESVTHIKFAWQMNSGDYLLSEIPLRQVKIRLNKEVTTPFIQFEPDIFAADTRRPPVLKAKKRFAERLAQKNPQDLFRDGDIRFVVITCRPEDWPVSIKMPMNE